MAWRQAKNFGLLGNCMRKWHDRLPLKHSEGQCHHHFCFWGACGKRSCRDWNRVCCGLGELFRGSPLISFRCRTGAHAVSRVVKCSPMTQISAGRLQPGFLELGLLIAIRVTKRTIFSRIVLLSKLFCCWFGSAAPSWSKRHAEPAVCVAVCVRTTCGTESKGFSSQSLDGTHYPSETGLENGEICFCLDNTEELTSLKDASQSVSLCSREKGSTRCPGWFGPSDLGKNCLKQCCYAICSSRENGGSAGS